MGKCGGMIVPRRKWNHTFNIESNTYRQIGLECWAAVGWHVCSGRFNSQLLCKDRVLHYEHINLVDLFLFHILAHGKEATWYANGVAHVSVYENAGSRAIIFFTPPPIA